MKHEGWASVGLDLGIQLPQNAAELLDRYEDLLRTRGAALGLIAASDLSRVRERHVLDGLRGAAHVPPGHVLIVDLGSGSGIPGIPVAVARPDAEVILVEVRRNRVAFLELVVDELRLPHVQVHLGRVEDLPGRTADLCLARAFAPPAVTWGVARPLLKPGGALLYWAGERFDPAADVPADARAVVPPPDRLAYGGPVVIMTAR